MNLSELLAIMKSFPINSCQSKTFSLLRKDIKSHMNHSLIFAKITSPNISSRVKMNTIVINMNNHRNRQKNLRKKQLSLFAQAKEIKRQLLVITKVKILKKERINKMMLFLKNRSYLNHNFRLQFSSIMPMPIKLILFRRKIVNLLFLSQLFWEMFHRIILSSILVISIKPFLIILAILILMIWMLIIIPIQDYFYNPKNQISTKLNNKKLTQIC